MTNFWINPSVSLYTVTSKNQRWWTALLSCVTLWTVC